MFNFNNMSVDSTFNHFKLSLEAIQDETTHASVVGQLKKAVKEVPIQENYYSVKFKKEIPSSIDPRKFWEIMEVKARQPQKYLHFVTSCEVLDEKVIGKIKHFVRRPNGEFNEPVWISESSRTMLFYFNYQGQNFLASNALKPGKDGKNYFVCRYVIHNGGLKSPEAFQEYMNGVFEKMVKL